MRGLPVSKSELTDEEDYECTYCHTTDKVQSCKHKTGLALHCSGCGRHGLAEDRDDGIDTGPFFEYKLN